ncbi:MAG: DUF58 domain-containing protein [bacterium]|nr:DUF58 domain-containing protein [bacterium]
MPKQLPLSQDIIRKIRHLEIYTKRLLSGSLVGDSRSARKGTGFEFDQIREYQVGDDVRFIDWKATARANQLLVKEYIEERSRVVLLVVDISGSSYFTSSEQLKYEVMAQVASVLALAADYGNDGVGLLLFSDEVELFIPPRRGRLQVHTIMEKLFRHKSQKTGTDLGCALERLAQLKRNDTIVFLISDFIGSYSTKYLPIIAKKYDTVAIRCLDKNEYTFPSVGFITVSDIETGQQVMIDSRNKKALASFLKNRIVDQDRLFKGYGVDVLDVSGETPFMGNLIRFFARRMNY